MTRNGMENCVAVGVMVAVICVIAICSDKFFKRFITAPVSL
jgi:hypothetical protein